MLAACSAPPPAPSREPAPQTPPLVATPIIDSHVHLAYDPVADLLAVHGLRAVVDLAAPESALATTYPITVIQSGPMLTRPGGYPLDSWGSEGYGVGCDTPECIDATITRLQQHGARVIKIALDSNGLDPVLARGAVDTAHALGLPVAVHALTDKSARDAAEIGADVLAHTPVEPLSAETVTAWQDACKQSCAVISTLAAFGGSDPAIDNLRQLRAAGLTVLYGTDLGNLRVDGPSQDEIALLRRAGLDDAAIAAAMTTAPSQFWGLDAH